MAEIEGKGDWLQQSIFSFVVEVPWIYDTWMRDIEGAVIGRWRCPIPPESAKTVVATGKWNSTANHQLNIYLQPH